MDTEILEKIKNLLIGLYHPIAIYIFGSNAWGNPTPQSDIDVCVIIKDSSEKMSDRIRKGMFAFWESITKQLQIITRLSV